MQHSLGIRITTIRASDGPLPHGDPVDWVAVRVGHVSSRVVPRYWSVGAVVYDLLGLAAFESVPESQRVQSIGSLLGGVL